MKRHIPGRMLSAERVIGVLVGLCVAICPLAVDCTPSTVIDFQVITDKTVYSPGSTMQVKFLIINSGEAPVYIPRGLNQCSYIGGTFFAEILDENGHDVTTTGCSSDVDPAWETAEMERITKQEFWIVLKPGEIFGATSALELPKRKGTYRLKAELTPPGFSAKAEKLLSDKGIRILQEARLSPVVRVVVK